MNERQLDKNAARRLAIIRHAREVTGNVALTCRYYGISRQVFYVWYRRYEAEGLAGLRDRSTRPAHCPHETPVEVVEKIIYLRQNYHFGPAKISMYLKRYHDIEISNSGVWRILKRLDLNRLPASQRYKRHDRKWKRYEKPLPGHAVQVDVKFIAPLSSSSRKKYYQFTAIDDCTRLRVLRIYDKLNQKTAIQFADFLLDKFPFRVEAIQTDNGPNSSRHSTGTCSTAVSATSTSSPPHRGSTARSNEVTGSTARSSTGCSRASSSTTPSCSTTSSPNGKPSTTTIAPTAPSAARPPTNASGRRPPQPRPLSKRSTSAAQDRHPTPSAQPQAGEYFLYGSSAREARRDPGRQLALEQRHAKLTLAEVRRSSRLALTAVNSGDCRATGRRHRS